MTKQRIIVLGVVVVLISMISFLCIFTYYRISLPVSKLKKEATKYQFYKKNFDEILFFLNASEIKNLRVMVNDYHVEIAQKLGVPGLIDDESVYQAAKEGKLVPLKESRYWRIKELKDSVAYVTPDTLKLLKIIGERFQENLKKQNLPLYRFTISSVLRTQKAQEALVRKNRNATKNISSHQFGTTVDILFTEFEYTADHQFTFACLNRYKENQEFKKKEFDDLAITYGQCLKTILAKTLLDLQKEGFCYVIYERRQPVFHVTIATKF
ncbi:MAG TPA: DUF5715 family protein [bacterium]|nr:DUF5715 family protein [bacterium]HOL34526.1 DUF5715 family protein [bacterium]HPP08062.1 DUF5715 family protein [bacterium]